MKTENKRNPARILKNGVVLVRTKATVMLPQIVQFKHLFKKRRQTSIILVVSAFLVLNVFLLNTIGGQLLSLTSLQSHGTIETIGVAAYTDSACTTLVSNVDWGKVTPGGYRTNTLYVRNEGNSDLTLSLEPRNWNPINAQNYMTLSWDYAGQTISPNQVFQVTLTLSVSENINGVESFYFDIVIMGTN